jgi:hypothetical protein
LKSQKNFAKYDKITLFVCYAAMEPRTTSTKDLDNGMSLAQYVANKTKKVVIAPENSCYFINYYKAILMSNKKEIHPNSDSQDLWDWVW